MEERNEASDELKFHTLKITRLLSSLRRNRKEQLVG